MKKKHCRYFLHTVTLTLARLCLSLILACALLVAARLALSEGYDAVAALREAPGSLRALGVSLMLTCGGCLALEIALIRHENEV